MRWNHKTHWVQHLQVLCICACAMAYITPSMAQKPAVHHVKLFAHWWTSTPLLSARWSPRGDRVVYVAKAGKLAHARIFRFDKSPHRHVDWGRSLDHFGACFGPVGTLVGGPASLAALPAKVPKKRAKVKKSKKPKKPTKPRRGIHLFEKKRNSYLYPGWKPRYSFDARRLLFSFKGVMYVWNPLPRKRSKALVMISRGYHPRWAYNGRAISFLRKPFSVDAKGIPKGGGIWFVDMLFRAGKLSNSGGEQSWATDNRSMAYVDALKRPGKPTVAAIFFRTLKKGKKPLVLAVGGRHPALPIRKLKLTKKLMAYQDARGVWVMHLTSRKRKLLAPGARYPAWSTRGDLMVTYPKGVALLRLPPTFAKSLAK